MDQKPGWQTTEFWQAAFGQLTSLLVALGAMKSSDAQSVASQLTSAAVACVALGLAAVSIWRYLQSRTTVKVEAMRQADPPANHYPPSVLPLVALALLLLPGLASAQPEKAVVRITSHGISATVIHTEPGRTYLLGCAHGYEREMARKPMTIDVPWTTESKQARITLVALDRNADLSLVRIDDGPVPCCIAVPGSAYRPGRLVSAGYDRMQGLVHVPTHLCTTFTRERPVEGRSGGGLIDEHGQLVGVCQGYEIRPLGRGMYVDHRTVIGFLTKAGWHTGDAPQQPYREPVQQYQRQFQGVPQCKT